MPQELRKRHKGHARKLKNLEERFVWYADAIEMEPSGRKGHWIKDLMPNAKELRLDLGCGKGSFTVEAALAEPDVLFIGLDYGKECVALAAQKALESNAANVVFTLADAEDIRDLFATDELSSIYLNFSTPHPRVKHAKERLTYVDELVKYRDVLMDEGSIFLKTDSKPFYDFSLTQFDMAAYDIVYESHDLRADRPELPGSEYEAKLSAKGAKVHGCHAVVAQRDISLEQTGPLSLFEYLPDDLDELDYVPHGMEGYVFNQRNLRAKQQARIGHK